MTPQDCPYCKFGCMYTGSQCWCNCHSSGGTTISNTTTPIKQEKKCTCGDTETQHYENTDKCVVCGCKEFEEVDPVHDFFTAPEEVKRPVYERALQGAQKDQEKTTNTEEEIVGNISKRLAKDPLWEHWLRQSIKSIITKTEADTLERVREKKEEAYRAWWNLIENHEWVSRNLDIEIMKVNPATNEVDDDQTKNTAIEYWLETGHFDKESNTFTHNYELDCGGSSFEEAILALEKLVNEHYPNPTDIFGEPTSLTENNNKG